ncbi:phage minor head protein [Methylocaldum sp.]|jgi:hypothetical protein|uniref:phage minor head protein n=1 Tax=Methylocaldum sp. TaxID=1969727 RepID=UPI00321FA681
MTAKDEREKVFRQVQKAVLKRRTALLRDTYADIVRLLEEALAQVRLTLARQPSDYQLWYLPQLQQEIEATLKVFGEQAGQTLSQASGDAWTLGQRLVDDPMAAAGLSVAGRLPALDPRQLVAIRTFTVGRIANITAEAAGRIGTQLGLVVTGAQSPGDAINAIEQVLGEQSRARARTIARTELGRLFAVASHERLMQAAEVVPGLMKMWRRSGKVHSRLSHDLTDGQIRPVDQPFVLGRKKVVDEETGGVRLRFPHDPKAPASETINCGCVMIPYMADWAAAGKMAYPGAKPFSAEEIRLNPTKAELADPPKPLKARESAKGGGRRLLSVAFPAPLRWVGRLIGTWFRD